VNGLELPMLADLSNVPCAELHLIESFQRNVVIWLPADTCSLPILLFDLIDDDLLLAAAPLRCHITPNLDGIFPVVVHVGIYTFTVRMHDGNRALCIKGRAFNKGCPFFWLSFQAT
jgi:hypothetical protein